MIASIKYRLAYLFFGDILFNREMSQEIDRLLVQVEELTEENKALKDKLLRAGWLD